MSNKHQKTKQAIFPYHLEIIGKTNIPSPQKNHSYMEYRRQWEENPKHDVISDFPLQLDIEPTGRCNLMCQHCVRHSRRTGIGDMDFDLLKKIIDEGTENNLYSVSFDWMGESFLHPQLMDMIEYAKSKGILETRISTNGLLIDKEKSREILKGNLDRIVFSIDSVTEQTYEKIKVGAHPGDFKLVNENIEYLIEQKERRALKKPVVTIQMIDQQQSHEEVMDFIYYWRTKADSVRIAIYQSPDGNPCDTRRAQNTPDTIFPCPQLWQRLIIAWDGSIYPCNGDNACRESLGNVKEDSIYDIWHGEQLTFLREKHKNYEADDLELCSHCDLNKIPEQIHRYNQFKND